MDFSVLSPERALEELGSTRKGLHPSEAGRRLVEYGPNLLSRDGHTPWWHRVIEPFKSLFVVILLVAGIISYLAGERLDAIVIGVIVAINAVIYYVQRFSTDRVLASLSRQDARTVTLLRDGQPVQTPAEKIVPGDIILISEGVKIPADGRLLSADALTIDESMLTGESVPVTKEITTLHQPRQLYDRINMVFSGSLLQSGSGEFLVTATGNETEIGHIARLSTPEVRISPLEQQITQLTSRVLIVIGIAMALTLGLALYRGIEFPDAVRFLLSLSVSAIPEGLPVALTLVLVFGMRRLAQHHALVRNISAVETLGQVQMVATDKTGTITLNKLSIAEYIPFLEDEAAFRDIIRRSVVRTHHHSDDPLENAISGSVGAEPNPGKDLKLDVIMPFDQAHRMSGAVWETPDGRTVYVKGAAENILAKCNLSPKLNKQVEERVHELSKQAYRVIAFAYRHTQLETVKPSELHGLTFAGLVALADEMRPDVTAAVRTAHDAGIDVVMLTGDHLHTAITIGKQASIIERADQAAEGSVLADAEPPAIRRLLGQIKVFARVLPEYKYAILEAYRGHKVTAMTGDGVNDVPALTKADVSIAVGRGTDAAKEAADVILLNNDFATIIEAIKQGRVILANIRKMLMYLFATSIGEVLTMAGALVINLPLPVSAIQILWVNLVTDTFAVIPLGLEPPESDQMHQKPIPRKTPILAPRHLVRLGLSGVLMATLVLTVFALYHRTEPAIAQTMAFCSLVVIQWTNAILMRKESAPLFSGRPNWLLYGSLSIAILLQALVIFGPLGAILHTQPLQPHHFVTLGIVALTAFVVGEMYKLATRPAK